MTERMRRARGSARDPHRRIEAWLADGAQEVLPRDVLVHASLCAECRLRIAALDLLSGVDIEQAGAPPPLAAADVRHARRSGRVAVAAGSAVAVSAAAVVVGVGASGWRPSLGGGGVANNPTEQPTQVVLGNTGQPSPSLAPSPTASATAGATASAVPSPSAPPLFTFPPTALPTVAVPSPAPTQHASLRPSATPRPTVVPTPVATPVPTPEPTPEATPEATPEPTPEETPPGP